MAGRGRSEPSAGLAVAAGGVLGASARWGVAVLLPSVDDGFPWGTLTANVVGCVLLGLVTVAVLDRAGPASLARPFLAVGVLGSFTTFSTLAVDGALLVDDGSPLVAVVYWAASLALGVVALLAGRAAGRRLVRGGEVAP
jgi:CrcB protein